VDVEPGSLIVVQIYKILSSELLVQIEQMGGTVVETPSPKSFIFPAMLVQLFYCHVFLRPASSLPLNHTFL